MSKRIVVDPVTRIEGHLRIEAEIENGKITSAESIAYAITFSTKATVTGKKYNLSAR